MPVQLALIDAASGAEIGRTDTRSDELMALNPADPEIVQIPLSTTTQKMWAKLWAPADTGEGARHPIVLILHGGNTYQAVGRYQHSSPSSAFFAQILADKGYLVLEMDYRGSIGYGRAWREAVAGQLGFAEVQDMRDAIALACCRAWRRRGSRRCARLQLRWLSGLHGGLPGPRPHKGVGGLERLL